MYFSVFINDMVKCSLITWWNVLFSGY